MSPRLCSVAVGVHARVEQKDAAVALEKRRHREDEMCGQIVENDDGTTANNLLAYSQLGLLVAM